MKEVILTKGKVALVDDEDYWNLMRFKWYAQSDGGGYYYAFNEEKGFMHSFVMNTEFPVDHKNNNQLDNRKENLRICTYSQNQANRRKTQFKTSSKYKGVTRHNGRWEVYIKKEYKRYYVGSYENEEDAAIAYNKKAVELYGEFAHLNIVN